MLKCLRMIDDIERKAGLYVKTRGIRLGGSDVVSLGLSASMRVTV